MQDRQGALFFFFFFFSPIGATLHHCGRDDRPGDAAIWARMLRRHCTAARRDPSSSGACHNASANSGCASRACTGNPSAGCPRSITTATQLSRLPQRPRLQRPIDCTGWRVRLRRSHSLAGEAVAALEKDLFGFVEGADGVSLTLKCIAAGVGVDADLIGVPGCGPYGVAAVLFDRRDRTSCRSKPATVSGGGQTHATMAAEDSCR